MAEVVLVADGDDASRALVVALLDRAGYATTEARTGPEALDACNGDSPLLAIVEVELESISGYETCQLLRERYGAEIPIVLTSGTRVEPIDRVAGLLIGADDYVVKPFDAGELLARVRTLLRRRNGSPSTNGNGRAAPSSRLDALTAREHEVLALLMRGRTQDEIALELFITPKTVATHIQRILGKLGVHSRAQAVAVALNGQSEDEFELHLLVGAAS